jgi:GNAT superfamily N-acetyltransferase
MNIKTIHHKDLHTFIESGEYQKSTYLPISSIRGLSQVKNPRALPDDLVLVMFFEQEEMQGYLGILPDNLYFKNDRGEIIVEHAGWLSCIWVNPKLRGKGIAKLLMDTVFKAWDYRILATEFTPIAKGLYDKCGQFVDLAKPEGIRAYMRLNLSYLLPAKNPKKWTKFKPLLKLTDAFINLFLSIRLLVFRPQKPKYLLLNDIDPEAAAFIDNNRSEDELMQKSVQDLKWIIGNPWLKTASKPDYESERYHFSSIADYFAFRIMKVYNIENQLIAVLILSIRDKNLKIPFSYLTSDAAKNTVAALEHFIRHEKLDMLTVFQSDISVALKKNCKSFFITRKMQRHYIISKKIKRNIGDSKGFSIQDGDADAAFT